MQPVFCPRCKHAVWFINPFCYKIINHDANICFVSPEDKGIAALYFQCTVDPCHESLSPCLLITGRTIYLTCKEEVFDPLCLKGRIELDGIDKIIFYGISGPCYLHALEALNGPEHINLDIKGKARREPVGVIFVGIKPFRL